MKLLTKIITDNSVIFPCSFLLKEPLKKTFIVRAVKEGNEKRSHDPCKHLNGELCNNR